DILLSNDERWCEEHMITGNAIDCTAHRVDHQTSRHRLSLDCCIDLAAGIERSLARTVLHQFNGLEQPASPDVANMMMIAEPGFQPLFEQRPHRLHVAEQVFAAD